MKRKSIKKPILHWSVFDHAKPYQNGFNSRLNYLFRKKHFLTTSLRRLLCNALIQPQFDYACTAWYPNLCKKLKNKIQTTQNKCVRFCLNLEKMAHISENEFEKLNWLPIRDRINQCILSTTFKFVNDMGPNYLKCFNGLLKAIEP